MSKNKKLKDLEKRQAQSRQQKAELQPKVVDPSKSKGNYLVQVVADGKVIKEVMALNSTVNIINLANQSVAADIK
ncbi:hypothetical protein [Clostridium coskatii]|uniref:Uncharacterized protein n=1 Tax=Clostridium coskatii TaxID=1705578 RepID=A0A166RD85_9CLOT|nr:hypothetical protein [Clostridium coskatii]OAA90701.1 hypothetical protein WX73_02066 [Clostridium coskatii]OBR97463.1 hypothetical protein CLCOS_03190 [Clostridium coskatii]